MPDLDMRDQSVSELFQRLSQQMATLVREEIRLAQAELKDKGKKAGIGVGLFGAAGLIGLYAAGAAVAGVVLLIAQAVATWIAAFITAGALAVIAAVMALAGKSKVEEATPPKPDAAIQSVQADVAEIKEKAHR
jgi:MFS family permease